MLRYLQYDFLKIDHFVTRRWRHPLHNHNHFEIIFVHRGKGLHCLSGMNFPYGKHSLFLLSPSDTHRFIVEEETEFTFLKFTNVYLRNMPNIQVAPAWNQEMDEWLVHAQGQEGSLLTSPSDGGKADRLCRLIVEEWEDGKKGLNETLFFLIQSLLSLVKRQESNHSTGPVTKHTAKVTALLHYVHKHIYCPANIQADHLAGVFGYSPHYLGPFFREQTGVTLRDYVSRYKFHLIRNRLLYSSFSIKEVSEELGFTDLSHFNKFFQRHAGMTPTSFRAAGR